MTFIECEEKLLKFVAQQGDSSTLQPVPCTVHPFRLHFPLSPVPLSALAVVRASEFKWQLSVATARSACWLPSVRCAPTSSGALCLPAKPLHPPSLPPLGYRWPCLVVAPCTSLCRALGACASQIMWKWIMVLLLHTGSWRQNPSGGPYPLPLPAAPLPLLIPCSLATSAKQNKSQMPHIINICALSFPCSCLLLSCCRLATNDYPSPALSFPPSLSLCLYITHTQRGTLICMLN